MKNRIVIYSSALLTLIIVVVLSFPLFQGEFGLLIFNPRIYSWLVPLLILAYLIGSIMLIRGLERKFEIYVTSFIVFLTLSILGFCWFSFSFSFLGDWSNASRCNDFYIVTTEGSAGLASQKVLFSENMFFYTKYYPLMNPNLQSTENELTALPKTSKILDSETMKKLESCNLRPKLIFQ